MGILYITDQGSYLSRKGSRLIVEKKGTVLQWVHSFKVDQVVLMGSISISPGAVAFLLEEGIDTVFLSYYGKYRGRLVSQMGKNIELRRMQFRKLEDPDYRLHSARIHVRGKIENCRLLLRRLNQDHNNGDVTKVVHRLRMISKNLVDSKSTDSLMGMEGTAAASYFGCFPHLIRTPDISFNGRNRRPPKDPVNVLLSLGYTLLANTVHTQVNVAGLDPYLGALHSSEYGRPSLVLDLMEEFRPVLVDSLVLRVINKKIIKAVDFFRPEDREPAAFDFAETEPIREEYPILLKHEAMKTFIKQFEDRLQSKVMYISAGKRLSYRDVILEQVRLFVRSLNGESEYAPFLMR